MVLTESFVMINALTCLIKGLISMTSKIHSALVMIKGNETPPLALRPPLVKVTVDKHGLLFYTLNFYQPFIISTPALKPFF